MKKLEIVLVSLWTSWAAAQTPTGVVLPDGKEFVSWEKLLSYTKTYYVDNRHPKAADTNPGTEALPFFTINKAAQTLQPGERVVISSGIYRERVAPARGGTGPDKMISYEAAPGAKVVVKGSRLAKTGWEPSAGFRLDRFGPPRSKARVFQRRLDDFDFQGYNPFGMASIMMDRVYLYPTRDELDRHLRRRGLVFVDGKRLEQVPMFHQLSQKENAYWVEQNGLSVHVRLAGDADPNGHEVELAIQEQVFAPRQRELGYIRVKGITFEHAADSFPPPQRALVSTSAGHHWIIEDCTIRHANAIGLDLGYQDWNMTPPELIGYHIVRRNYVEDAGICGIAGMGVRETLIEANLIENIGWHDVELLWETGGIKLHTTKSCLLRNNVIRHLKHGGAIWLDYQNSNTRVTANVMGDAQSTLRGGIYLEASQEPNMLDHNIIWNATEGKGGGTYDMKPHGGWGILVDGSDEAVIAHNLIGRCQDAAIKTRTVESRIVGPRGGTSRWNKVLNNIFHRNGKGIDFSTQENTADGNLYGLGADQVEDETRGEGRGLNWTSWLNPALRLDLPAWQKFFGFDKNGAYAEMNIEVDLDALKLTWSVAGRIPEVATEEHFRRDFRGRTAAKTRKAGPLIDLPAATTTVDIDPRPLVQ
jgi:hypothetical protein